MKEEYLHHMLRDEESYINTQMKEINEIRKLKMELLYCILYHWYFPPYKTHLLSGRPYNMPRNILKKKRIHELHSLLISKVLAQDCMLLDILLLILLNFISKTRN